MKYPRNAGIILASFTAGAALLATSALLPSPVTFAEGPLPPAAPVERASGPQTFTWMGETIMVQGNYSVGMVGDSIHITVPSGAAMVQIVGKQEIDLTGGDDIMLIPTSSASVRSIAVSVLKGEATVGPVQISHDDETGTILTSQTAFSIATGKNGNGDESNMVDQPDDSSLTTDLTTE